MIERIPRYLAGVVFVATAAFAFARLPARAASERSELFVPRPEVARLGALGFEAVLADAYWLLAVQIVGRKLHVSEEAPLLARLIDVVTTVDPWVDHPYRFAAVWLTDSVERVRHANAILERGIAHHPDDWRNRFHLGFNHFFYLGENERAAEVLEGAIGLPGSPRYLHRLVARLRADGDGLDVAAAFLHELVQGAPDPYARAEYEKALDEIEAERRARTLDAAREEFRRRAGRDLAVVEELVQGPHAVLRALPAEPNGFEWVLSPDDGRIVSSFYRHRYEPQIHPTDRARRAAWSEEAGSREEAR